MLLGSLLPNCYTPGFTATKSRNFQSLDLQYLQGILVGGCHNPCEFYIAFSKCPFFIPITLSTNDYHSAMEAMLVP